MDFSKRRTQYKYKCVKFAKTRVGQKGQCAVITITITNHLQQRKKENVLCCINVREGFYDWNIVRSCKRSRNHDMYMFRKNFCEKKRNIGTSSKRNHSIFKTSVFIMCLKLENQSISIENNTFLTYGVKANQHGLRRDLDGTFKSGTSFSRNSSLLKQ